MYARDGFGAAPAFPTIATWKTHVAISGGVVTRMPAGRPYAGQLAARYGGPGTRWPNMAVTYTLADLNIRSLDNMERAEDSNRAATQAANDAPRAKGDISLPQALSDAGDTLGKLVGLAPWALALWGATKLFGK